MMNQLDFFYENGRNWGTEVKKSLSRWEMNGLSEGYKRVVDQNWGRMANIGVFGQKPRFWDQKKALTSLT